MNTISIKRNWQYILLFVIAASVVALLAWSLQKEDSASDRRASNTQTVAQTETKNALEDHAIVPLDSAQASNSPSTADELAYLIEEEKLAHDVYQVMYDTWGVRVFNNIKNSETTHQNLVSAVMESRGLTDPRSSELGTFTNQDLQKFYDTLIAQGMQSQTEAFKVGVIIEETDIADLRQTLDNLDQKDTDVKDVLEILLNGSENHLRAFNRQLSR